MVTVASAGATREGLEQVFIRQHAPFATAWALSRERRTSTWTSPGGRLRIVVSILPHEYIEPGCSAGFLGDAVSWDGQIQRLRKDLTWWASPVRVTNDGRLLKPAKPGQARRSA